MKPLSAFYILAAVWLLGTACRQQPRPVTIGKDGCAFCKMTVMDPRFASELITAKGRLHIFDDINCLISYAGLDAQMTGNKGDMYVADFASPHAMHPAETMHFVRSEEWRSPMAGNVAAFSSRDSAEAAARRLGSKVESWSQLIQP